MLIASTWLQNLGFALYTGPILLATAAIGVSFAQGKCASRFIRRFQSLGPMLGIALGACILGGLVSIWLQTGTFSWSLAPGPERMRTLTHALFFVGWISNIKLEVWTLEPLRTTDPDSEPEAYRRNTALLLRHMVFQSAVLLTVAALGLSALR
jgi:hypothetical protein